LIAFFERGVLVSGFWARIGASSDVGVFAYDIHTHSIFASVTHSRTHGFLIYLRTRPEGIR
jgi:hypothetical protein